MTPQSAESLEKLDPFDHAFVDAVLRLRGIDEEPSLEQFRAALETLANYYAALMKAVPSNDPRDEEWLDGHTIESAACQFAFLFVHYGVLYVSQATPAQYTAFEYWWNTGDMPNEISLRR